MKVERTTAFDAGGRPVEVDGVRRLALLVGIGKYRSAKLPDLRGPEKDARAVYQLLTSPRGYGFPPENVCMLLDEEATVRGFREAFRKALIERARPEDIAFFYYAGHGSQVRDQNGDEPDGWDETLVLHDSRTGGVSDLVDDELNDLLAALHARTRDITVVLDSCTSGSVTRDGVSAVPRMVDPATGPREAETLSGPELGPASQLDWVPKSLPGLVVLSAAKDGTPALEPEGGGHGFFTSAFLDVLSEVSERPLTWAQVGRRMPRLVAHLSRGRQCSTFQGRLDRYVFDCRERRRPMGWEITEIGEAIEMQGVPLPGWGVGAEVRVYPGNAERGETKDPSKAKAALRVTRFDGVSATAERLDSRQAPIEIGDLALLLLPGADSLKLPVRILSGNGGGLGERQKTELRRALERNPQLAGLFELTEHADAFTVGQEGSHLWIRGPEGVVRNELTGSPEAQAWKTMECLGQHARQLALLMLKGETGSEFDISGTLEVRILPVPPPASEGAGTWVQAEPNTEQVIADGTRWQIEVKNVHAEITLLVGGAVLWSDGGTDGVPFAGEEIRLAPGESTILDPDRPFEATSPFDAVEHVVIFGTQEDNPINWSLLTDPARSAERGMDGGPLQRLLAGYVSHRGGKRVAPPKCSTWTSSHLPIRVVESL